MSTRNDSTSSEESLGMQKNQNRRIIGAQKCTMHEKLVNFWCSECTVAACLTCVTGLHRGHKLDEFREKTKSGFSSGEGSKPTLVTKREENCPSHIEKLLSLWCKKCAKLCCEECVRKEHKGHELYKDLQTNASRIKLQIYTEAEATLNDEMERSCEREILGALLNNMRECMKLDNDIAREKKVVERLEDTKAAVKKVINKPNLDIPQVREWVSYLDHVHNAPGKGSHLLSEDDIMTKLFLLYLKVSVTSFICLYK